MSHLRLTMSMFFSAHRRYVFCTIVTMIAEGWSSSKDIEEEISKELTKIAFEHFRSEKKTFNDNPSWNGILCIYIFMCCDFRH